MITPENAEVIFVSHSGGIDSMAQTIKLLALGYRSKMVLIHADLKDMEWESMHDWITRNSFDLPLVVVSAKMDFFEYSRHYGRILGGQHRSCSGKLKTDPINSYISQYCKTHGITRALSAVGIRRNESATRATALEFVPITKIHSKWHPILDYTKADSFAAVHAQGQEPHWVYKHASRLSCAVCVYGRVDEWREARDRKPELWAKLSALEIELQKTIRMKSVKGQKVRYFMQDFK
jgi:3'-phosphoadenosine 5'-phosphosulfate sulfotransferase (PAPS reductase)/FAD synthetase